MLITVGGRVAIPLLNIMYTLCSFKLFTSIWRPFKVVVEEVQKDEK